MENKKYVNIKITIRLATNCSVFVTINFTHSAKCKPGWNNARSVVVLILCSCCPELPECHHGLSTQMVKSSLPNWRFHEPSRPGLSGHTFKSKSHDSRTTFVSTASPLVWNHLPDDIVSIFKTQIEPQYFLSSLNYQHLSPSLLQIMKLFDLINFVVDMGHFGFLQDQ